MDLESSTDQELDAKPANSSDADDGAKQDAPESMFDAVKSAIEKDQEQKEESPASNEDQESEEKSTQADGEKPAGESESEDETKDSDKDLPFHNHPRWQEMLKENRDLKAAAEDTESYKERAERFDQINSFVTENQLEPQEIQDGFRIMALMKTDPAGAMEALRPYWDSLQQVTGVTLSPELQEQVDRGVITRDYAEQLSKSQANTRILESRMAVQQEKSEASQRLAEETQRNDAIKAATKATQDWEKAWSESDPDFAKKQPLVRDRVLTLMQTDGVPRNAKEAVALSEKAKAQIEEQLAPMLGQRKEKRMVTGGGSSGQKSPQPTTLREAVQLAAQGTRQG